METNRNSARATIWTRLRGLRSSGATISIRALSPAALSTAVRMVLGMYPSRFRHDAGARERELAAFVTTVIPGSNPGEPHLTTMYSDPYYPFFPYSGYLVYDLTRRSRQVFSAPGFAALSPELRMRVVEHALASDDVTARLYRGAILMAKVSYYAAIYHPDRGCPLIDFPGTNRGYPRSAIGRPHPRQYLGTAMTPDGNPP